MPHNTTNSQLRDALEELWQFRHPTPTFWQALLQTFTGAADAATAVVLCRQGTGTPWRSLAIRPEAEETRQRLGALSSELEQVADLCIAVTDTFSVLDTDNETVQLSALPLLIRDEETELAVVTIRYAVGPCVFPDAALCHLMSDTLLICGISDLGSARSAPDEHEGQITNPLVTAMDMVHLLNNETRYIAACMLICNELATRFSCDRVSIAKYNGQYAVLETTSHAQKVSRKMESSRLLVAAMEEAIEQDDEVLWPSPLHQWVIDRDHERYTRDQAVRNMVTIPLRLNESPTAVIALERNRAPFSAAETDALRLVADLCARRLEDLRLQDRWIGARWGSNIKKGLAVALGREHTLARLAAVLVALLALFTIFFEWDYRIAAPFAARADFLTHIPAPFDAYIEDVSARIGDYAQKDQTLLTLDSREIELQRQEVQASIDRYESEAQLAQAEGKPSEVHIALSKAEEYRVQLKKLDYNLARTTIKAPLDGIIVQGELEERVGSPVKKGEPLFQITHVDRLYLELKVHERDIAEIHEGAVGNVAFTSRPQERFPFVVDRIEPVAIAESKGNIFIVRCTPTEVPEGWWRPGLSGTAKIDAGPRRLIWVLTHRLVDFLRIKLWM